MIGPRMIPNAPVKMSDEQDERPVLHEGRTERVARARVEGREEDLRPVERRDRDQVEHEQADVDRDERVHRVEHDQRHVVVQRRVEHVAQGDRDDRRDDQVRRRTGERHDRLPGRAVAGACSG